MTIQDARHSEPVVNRELGNILRRMLSGCVVRSENTRIVKGNASLQIDNLVTAMGRAPVVVEAEYAAAGDAQDDAIGRLGLPVVGEIHPIEAAIALQYPDAISSADDLHAALIEADFSYAVHYQDGSRFPKSGWLTGGATDLADLIRLASVPEKAVNDATDRLQQGIDRAANVLGELSEMGSGVTGQIAALLGMTDVPQTRRMASAILANAMIFHQRLSRMHPEIKSLRLVCGPGVPNPQDATLSAWEEILGVNYWAIFAIARDILNQIPNGHAVLILDELRETAQHFDSTRVDHAHHLTGQIFQRLISDRKYLATFYTRPESAALLARLAVEKLDGVDWGDAKAIGRLRVGDFACGTGALLSAVYDQLSNRHANAGGDPAELHADMMEEVLYGCDVMPSAIHLSGSTLSGVRPDIGFNKSRLYTMPYGRQGDGSVKIGSLELLQSSEIVTLFNTSDPALRTGSVGEETAAQVNVEICDEMFDLVIMNPPFTRNVTREGATAGTIAAIWAAFDASDADQRDMAKRMDGMKGEDCYHGNAGIASAFAALAHRKLKPGGVLALVLPLTAAAGTAWQEFRRMLADDYSDLDVVSIAANRDEVSFSSDTSIAECLVVARKRVDNEDHASTARFTSLVRRPESLAHAASVAVTAIGVDRPRGVDDGPLGGTQMFIGTEPMGETLRDQSDFHQWQCVRLKDGSVAQTAHALARSKLWLPSQRSGIPLSIVPISSVGSLGMYHLDVIGPAPRGPFDKSFPSPTATFPAIWNHNAKKETRMVCEPDSELRVRQGMEDRWAAVWGTASRAHVNQDFRFNSQPLTAAFTERKTIGGVAWPNVGFADDRFDFPFVLWCNSTLGLVSFWWHANRQQDGRGRITVRSAESLPVLDLRKLSDDQLSIAEGIFDEFRDKDLKPAYLADADPNRALLDRCVIRDLLGFDEDVYEGVRRLAAKWCAEPSVHGGKKRPSDAELVI